MHQACVFENQHQYRRSHEILTSVIANAFEKGDIDQSLKEAIEGLQVKMKLKETYLAYYIRCSISYYAIYMIQII